MAKRSRADTSKGWNPQDDGSSMLLEKDSDGSYRLTGRIVHERSNGNMRRVMSLACAGQSVVLHLDAERFPGTLAWMSIKGARKLICPGVRVSVTARLRKEKDEATKDEIDEATGVSVLQLNAESILIDSVLPSTPYLARLFSFSGEDLRQLFPGPMSLSLPTALVTAVRPCEAALCEKLVALCNAERTAGRMATLFKKSELEDILPRIRYFQQWTRTRVHRRPPPTKRFALESLQRLEAQWCRDDVDGPMEEYGSSTTDNEHKESASETAPLSSVSPPDRLIFGNRNVDPSLNLPDPTDARRIKYMDERKRPQIQWMLRLILRLLDCDHFCLDDGDCKLGPPPMAPHKLHLVDIGGGRGDLAMTVAAFLTQAHLRKYVQAHVTVIDVNQPSLQAGETRARSVGLEESMDFVLCDVSDDVQIQSLLNGKSFDLFFGLHCCGGLAEAAVELALRARAGFCISTCCFRSNPSLASLTRLSESLLASAFHKSRDGDDDDSNEIGTYRDDLFRVAVLTTGASTGGQHRAIRALNAIRRVSAKKRFQELSASSTGKLRIWQESFPFEYSVQNRVLVGKPQEGPE